ncbi:MFS transporter [Brevibacterium sp. 50QC2O2]|jgi:EmrB/QacA subfamily drug resistance transporter|uniref:MDR family MFS transporter n=1 Tax=Brevibacterium TaxID=1696 RepID=UPI00211CF285|nr:MULTISPECIES: MDR family MFS transporter [unclassified Brevibacterium]MCQ9366952.1 MFS transporter [Brevibacterium sp. 91QC2O2]MCQ9384101.1 MFS transporter [Brevibacterium sp. 68QC2CO]MCQ9388421.1 MFS transporter [Brevibacterium sp. 50QC2O2]
MSTPESTARRAQARHSHPGDGEMSQSGIILLFVGLMIAMLMFSLNQTMLGTALPTIVGELNGVDQMLWVSTAFMLASTIMMPIYGKLSDMFNRKYIFIAAIVVFLAGSIVAFFAHNMALLILGRVLQGIGGGGLMILSQSIIAAVVPARQRGKYMGIMGANFAVSSVAGPLIGGWITEGPGWRWNFALMIPLGILALISAIIFLKVPHLNHGRKDRKLDIAGMVLIAEFTSALILATAWGGHQYEWTDPVIVTLLGVAVASAVVFVFVENAVDNPIIPMSLFTDRNFVLCTISGIFVGIGMFGALSYLPTFLQMVHGIAPTPAGLMMVPMNGVMLPVSIIVGFLVSKTGRYKFYPVIGLALVGVALVLLGTVTADQNAWVMIGYLCVMGLGLGLGMQTLVLIVQNSFPVSMVGTATASNNFFRQIGATLGMSVIGSLFTNRLTNNLSDGLKQLGPEAAKAMSGGGANSLTPDFVKTLANPVHDMITHAYADALVPVFMWVSPTAFIGAIILLWVKEKALATKIVQDTPEAHREILDTNTMAVVGDGPATADAIEEALHDADATEANPGDGPDHRAGSPAAEVTAPSGPKH